MPWRRITSNRLASRVLLLLLYFSAVVILQWRGNAYRSEFGGDADEAGHYVTGLLVRQYLAAGMPGRPLAYARNYYLHYPRVALGHWPPFFYVVQAAWTLPFTPSRTSVMLLMAAITALLALLLCEAVREEFSASAGLGAAAVFISLPVVEEFSHLLMAEMLLALLVLLAVLSYGRYLETERWQAAAWFGLWCSLAILTKGTGIELALVPPLAVFLTRRWRLLRRFSFWLPAILVMGTAGPWYLFVPGAQHESVARFGGIVFQQSKFVTTPAVWAGMLGVVPAMASLLGLLLYGARIYSGKVRGKWLAGVSVLVSAYLFRLVISAWEDRHLVTTIPILLMFAVAGVSWLVSRARRKRPGFTLARIVAGLGVAVLVTLNIRGSPLKRQYGFSEVAQNLLSNPQFNSSVFLVCGGAGSEGMLISEVARRELNPGHIVLRASKMLASSDWMGGKYRALFHTEAELAQYLEGIPVGIVVLGGDCRSREHGRLLSDTILHRPEQWALYAKHAPGSPQPTGQDDILVYRLIGHEGRSVGRIAIPMQFAQYGSFGN